MKRKMIFILVLLLLLTSIFNACASSKSSMDTDGADEKRTDSTTELKPGQTGQREIVTRNGTFLFNEEGYPITENPSTFTILAATNLLSFDDSKLMNNIAEHTNVYPEWICIPRSAAAERKSLLYASGDYPDVLGPRMVSKADTIEHGPAGILLNIKDLLYKYATNLNTFLTPDLWAQLECYDGNIYFFPTIYANRGSSGNATQDNFFVMPKAWMEKLNLKVATNIDEFYNNLIAIRDGDPNENGKKDEVPLAIQALSGNPLDALASYFCWFGRPGKYYIDDDGTVIDGRLYDEHKEGIKFLQKCYKEDLLDKEIFSLDLAAFRAKGAADPDVYGYIFGYSAAYYTNSQKAEELYDVMPLLQDQNGNIQYIFRNQSSSAISYQMAVTSACECPEIVARWVNYLYDPLVTLQMNNGPLDVRFGYDEKGNLICYNDIDNPDKIPEGYDGFTSYRDANQDIQMPRLSGPLLVDEYLKKEYGYISKPNIGGIQNIKGEELWAPYAVQEFPVVTPSDEESQQLALYETDINKLYNETVTAWIIGNGDIDSEWNAFIKQMNAFGAQEVLKIRQAQADRYFRALNK